MPHILLTADSPEFNRTAIEHWEEEGFTVTYLAHNNDQKDFASQLTNYADSLSANENFALVGVYVTEVLHSDLLTNLTGRR